MKKKCAAAIGSLQGPMIVTPTAVLLDVYVKQRRVLW